MTKKKKGVAKERDTVSRKEPDMGRPLEYQEWFDLVPDVFVLTYPATQRLAIEASVRNYNKKYNLNLKCWIEESGEVVVEAVK